jgi:hypothetical protein
MRADGSEIFCCAAAVDFVVDDSFHLDAQPFQQAEGGFSRTGGAGQHNAVGQEACCAHRRGKPIKRSVTFRIQRSVVVFHPGLCPNGFGMS